mgnify:CR=1 FL=1
MADILQEVLKKLDDNKEISSASFEAANIILYTKILWNIPNKWG